MSTISHNEMIFGYLFSSVQGMSASLPIALKINQKLNAPDTFPLKGIRGQRYKRINILTVLLMFFIFNGQSKELMTVKLNDSLTVKAKLIYSEDFDKDLSNWTIEKLPTSKVENKGSKMDIDVASGCTAWYNKCLTGPTMIEYDAVVIKNGGPNDRGSDLNCFWMATDPLHPDDIFKDSKSRNGDFGLYTPMRLYYVGYGGNKNSTTRFRKYDGEGNRHLLPEHNLTASEFLIVPNILYKIRLVAYNGIIQYYRNGELLFNFFDTNPYTSGYFGIRTVKNHMTVDNLRIYSLKK